MQLSNDSKDTIALLRDSGLPHEAAVRMASEWRAHLEDLDDELSKAGLSADERHAELARRMGDIHDTAALLATLPASQWVIAGRELAVTAFRWSGASLAGMLTTLCLFAVMNHAITL